MDGAGRAGAALLLVAALCGCATVKPAGPGPAATGRLAVQVAAHGDQPARGVSAAFELRGDGRTGEMVLNSPLGLRVAEARWSPGLAVLTTDRGEARYSDLHDLARDALGESVPLQALPDWLQGRAWPGAPAQPVAGGFEQLGWQVDLSGFTEGLLVAVRSVPPAVTVRARLERPS